jgi:hypothetical protein
MEAAAGTRISVGGGYDFEPAWLGGKRQFVGKVLKWIPGPNEERACVVELEEALTATGLVRGRRQERTGRYLVLKLRYAGQVWGNEGTVHVELCPEEPVDAPWPDREIGAWVESHATYRLLS